MYILYTRIDAQMDFRMTFFTTRESKFYLEAQRVAGHGRLSETDRGYTLVRHGSLLMEEKSNEIFRTRGNEKEKKKKKKYIKLKFGKHSFQHVIVQRKTHAT